MRVAVGGRAGDRPKAASLVARPWPMTMRLDQRVGRSPSPPKVPIAFAALESHHLTTRCQVGQDMRKKAPNHRKTGLRGRCQAAVSSESILIALTIRLFRVSGSFAEPIQFR